jgi:hypothetical protein
LAVAELEGEYIHLPSDLPARVPPPLRTSILVRKEYHKLVEHMHISEGGRTYLDDPVEGASEQPPMNVEASATASASSGVADFTAAVEGPSEQPPMTAEASATASTSSGVAVLKKKKKEPLGIALSGTPGVGKSSGLPFVVANLAKYNQTAVYRFKRATGDEYILLDFSSSPPKVDFVFDDPYKLEGEKCMSQGELSS